MKTCPNCHKPLASNAPDGLCPECLVKAGLPTGVDITDPAGPHGTKVTKPPPTPDEIRAFFPQFDIMECLGRGGMGVVYKARQKSLDRIVALKILAPEKEKDPQFAGRFGREARTLAKLNHPSIVTVHDFGEAGRMFYLVMEFVDGVNLRHLLRERKLSPEEALAIVPKVCEALQFAHEQGIVHRDIKPENLLLDRQGRIKIADFGIAKILGRREPGAGETREVIGTPQYMAPEQVQQPQRVDHRADIYSLGVVLYEMLTGEVPGAKIQPPSKKVQLDVRIDEIVMRALEQEPELRYQTAADFRTQVETFATTSSPGSSRREEAQTGKAATVLNAIVVGTRNGQRVINWPGVIQAWLLPSIVIGFVFWGLCRLFGMQLSFWASSAYGLVSAALVVGSGVVRGWSLPKERLTSLDGASKAAREARALPEPRFSRTAIVGAVWAVLGTFVVIGGGLLAQTYPDSPPRGLFRAFMMVAWVAGLTAPVGTTILGWVALAQIRRSAGKLYGVRLAMFNGLVFPFLVLVLVLQFVWYCLLDWGFPVLQGLGIRQPSLAFFLIVWLPWLAGSIALGVWTARRAKRAINQIPGLVTPAPASRSERFLWKFTAATVLVLLGLGTWVYWAQRPRELGMNLGSESPDGRYSAMAQTFHEMRVFGGDKTYYRFTVQGEGGTLFQQWKIPVPTAKLATNYVALSLDEVVFNSTNRSTSGSIQWSEDSQRVTFSIRGIEVFGYNVKTRGTSSQEGYLSERQVTLTAGDDLQNCYLDLDTGRVLSPPKELVASLRVNGRLPFHTATDNSAMRAWLRTNGVDLVRRERDEGLFQMDGASGLIAGNRGPFDDPRAFDTLSTEFVVQWAEYFEQLRTNLYWGEQFKSGEPLPYYVSPGGVYVVKTREGGIALVEILKDNPRSGRTELRYKLVKDAKAKPTAPAAEQNLSFGPVINRVVNDISAGSNSFLNLETGKLLTPFDKIYGEQQMRAWSEDNDADVSFSVKESSGVDWLGSTLFGGFTVGPVDWDTATPESVVKAARETEAKLAKKPDEFPRSTTVTIHTNSTASYACKTRKGRLCLLQITGFTDNPRGVKIRYKLVQDGKNLRREQNQ